MQTQQQIINKRTYHCPSCNKTALPEIPLERIKETEYALICKINVKGLCNVCPIDKQKTMYVCTGPCEGCRISRPSRIYENDGHKKCIDTNADISRDEVVDAENDIDTDFFEQAESWDEGIQLSETHDEGTIGQIEHLSEDSEGSDEDPSQKKGAGKWLPPDNGTFFHNAPLNEWPKTCRDYFRNEAEKKGSGIKNIVCKALSGREIISDRELNDLTDSECDFHMHMAQLHDNTTAKTREGFCQSMGYIHDHQSKRLAAKIGSSESIMKESFLSALQERGDFSNEELQDLEQKAYSKYIQSKALTDEQNDSKYSLFPTSSTVRTKYLDEGKGIIKNVPHPDIHLLDHCDKDCNKFTPIESKKKRKNLELNSNQRSDDFTTQEIQPKKKRKYAFMPPEQIINFFLASGTDAKYYRIGYDSDFYLDPESKSYECKLIEDLHKMAIDLRTQNPDLPSDTRIVLMDLWTDGFENKKISPNPAYNNVNAFTLTLQPSTRRTMESFTLPTGLTYKRENHRDVLLQILRECRKMREPTMRYWGGKENRAIPTIVWLRSIIEDYPERASMTCTSEMGTYHMRWTVSMLYDDKKTPSCPHCEANRINAILKNQHSDRIPACIDCQDWQYYVDTPKVHPIDYPAIKKTKVAQCKNITFDPVRLTFDLLHDSLEKLQNDVRELKKPPLKGQLEYIIQILCLCGGKRTHFADQILKGLKDHGVNFDITKCDLYPRILAEFKELGIDLTTFSLAPMHMLFLGNAKACIAQLPRIFGDSPVDKKALEDLIEHLNRCQEQINKLSIDWCVSMRFSGKDNDIVGTAKWVSKNCVAFVRMSLYYFSFLDVLLARHDLSPETVVGLKAYRKMVVSFYLLISYMFDDDYKALNKTDEKIEHYVRLYLSACRYFDMNARTTNDSEANNRPKKSDDSRAFFLSKQNLLSLLELPRSIQQFGHIAGMYEGSNEGYVRYLKREMSVMMHNDEFLERIVTKTARTRFLEVLMKDNSFNQAKHTRLSNVPIYSSEQPKNLIANAAPFGGMIDCSSKLWLCFRGPSSTIETRPLLINDTVGRKYCNMWYAMVGVDMDDSNKIIYPNREAFLKECHDYFIAAGIQLLQEKIHLYTIVTRGWKIRKENGTLGIIDPDIEILLLKD